MDKSFKNDVDKKQSNCISDELLMKLDDLKSRLYDLNDTAAKIECRMFGQQYQRTDCKKGAEMSGFTAISNEKISDLFELVQELNNRISNINNF